MGILINRCDDRFAAATGNDCRQARVLHGHWAWKKVHAQRLSSGQIAPHAEGINAAGEPALKGPAARETSPWPSLVATPSWNPTALPLGVVLPPDRGREP
jgi:hypothetical protein